jgi:hypothetical protein
MLGASLGGLDPSGWRCDEDGEIKTGEPQCNEEEEVADFVHSQSLKEGDVWRMQVVAGGGAMVGIAAERYCMTLRRCLMLHVLIYKRHQLI